MSELHSASFAPYISYVKFGKICITIFYSHVNGCNNDKREWVPIPSSYIQPVNWSRWVKNYNHKNNNERNDTYHRNK